MAEDASQQQGHWSRRLERNQPRMRSGEPTAMAKVVRDLTAKALADHVEVDEDPG